MAPTVVRDGEFTFVIHSREHSYEPPHVHVRFGGNEVRMRLDDGAFLEQPPAGRQRSLREAWRRHAATIRACWQRLHDPQEAD